MKSAKVLKRWGVMRHETFRDYPEVVQVAIDVALQMYRMLEDKNWPKNLQVIESTRSEVCHGVNLVTIGFGKRKRGVKNSVIAELSITMVDYNTVRPDQSGAANKELWEPWRVTAIWGGLVLFFNTKRLAELCENGLLNRGIADDDIRGEVAILQESRSGEPVKMRTYLCRNYRVPNLNYEKKIGVLEYRSVETYIRAQLQARHLQEVAIRAAEMRDLSRELYGLGILDSELEV